MGRREGGREGFVPGGALRAIRLGVAGSPISWQPHQLSGRLEGVSAVCLLPCAVASSWLSPFICGRPVCVVTRGRVPACVPSVPFPFFLTPTSLHLNCTTPVVPPRPPCPRRAYFRTQVKDSEAQSHYGSMR